MSLVLSSATTSTGGVSEEGFFSLVPSFVDDSSEDGLVDPISSRLGVLSTMIIEDDDSGLACCQLQFPSDNVFYNASSSIR